MITYINKDNANKYTELYKSVKDETGLIVNNIEQYLANLSTLATKNPKYVRLPLVDDEGVFTIKANERIIDVPSDFKKNGVGVVGDELAEVIYFKLPRFFDIVDLANGMEYYIQWENASGEKGVSKAYAVSWQTETDEYGNDNDFIYFGWALSSTITGKAGTIKFNVRILRIGDASDSNGNRTRIIEYSFNTQPQSITIKAGLNYDFTKPFTHQYDEIDATDKIFVEDLSGLVNGRLMDGNTAHCPVFERLDDKNGQPLTETGNIKSVATIDDVLYVNAVGLVHEMKFDEDGNSIGDSHNDNEPIITYKWYYKGPEDKVFNQVLTDTDQEQALTVTGAGEYYVVAFATYKIDETSYTDKDGQTHELEYHTSTASSKSIVCRVPLAVPVEIVTPLPLTYIIRANAPGFIEVKGGQQQVEDINGNFVNVGKLSIELFKAAQYDENGNLINNKDLVFTPYTGSNITCVVGSNDEDDKFVEDADGRLIHIIPATEWKEETYKDVEGFYKISIINTTNNHPMVTEDDEHVCRITYAPQKPEIAATPVKILTPSGNTSSVENATISLKHKVEANYTIQGSSDEQIINWYKVINIKDPDDPEGSVGLEDRLVATGIKIFTPEAAGSYYYTIQNKLNGELSEVASSAEFVVKD